MNRPALVPVQPVARRNVWATNGGIYFGLQTEPPADPDRPLAGRDSSMRAQTDPRTFWKPSGDENAYTADRHVITIGPNGSGKTRKLLLPNVFRLREWSKVLIDPKGEICAHTAPYLASIPGHKVVVVDPFGVMQSPQYAKLYAKHGDILQSRGFNPLAALDAKSPRMIDGAKAIAEALIKIDDARDPYWPQAAQALCKGIIIALVIARDVKLMKLPEADERELQATLEKINEEAQAQGRPPVSAEMVEKQRQLKTARLQKVLDEDKADLATFRRIIGLSPDELARWCKLRVGCFGREFSALGPSIGRYADYKPDNRELSAVLGTAMVQTDWLDSPEIQADLLGEPFDFGSLKTTPTSVFFILPPEFLGSHSVWLRLMVSAALRPLLRSVETGERTVPVLFMLDEFAQLGYMKIIEDNYALLRGYGVKLWTIWQDLTQAKNLYKDRWESFMSNAGIRQTFAPQDLTTRDYLARMSDKRQKWHTTESSSVGLALKSLPSLNMSSGETRLDDAVFHPHELSALDLDEAVLWDRMMQYHLSVTPQPELLTTPFPGAGESVSALMAQARAAIDG